MKGHQEILDNFTEGLEEIRDPKAVVEEILEFALVYGDSYGERLTPLLEKAMRASKEIGFTAGEILAHYHIVFFQDMTQGPLRASQAGSNMPNLEELSQLLRNEPYWYSITHNLLAFYHWFRGDYEKGFNTAFEALRSVGDQDDKNVGWHYFALGVFYFDTKDLNNSLLYYQKAREVFLKYDYAYGAARATNGIATACIYLHREDEATTLLEYAAGIYRHLGHYAGLSRAVNDMALIEKNRRNFERSIALFKETIELRKEINHIQGLATSLTELGEIYLWQEDFAKAEEFLLHALDLSYQASAKQKSMRIHKLLYDMHKKFGHTEKALGHFEQYYDLKTQLMGDEANNNIKRLQTQFEKQKSEQEAEIERLRNVELKKAYEVIEQRNKDIHDSIHYASRIQRSLIPTDKVIQKILERLRRTP